MLPNGIFKDEEFSKKIRRIINDLGFSHEEDLKARDILLNILEKRKNYPLLGILDSIKSLIQRVNHVVIFGGGPDAARFMKWISEYTDAPYFNRKSTLVVAIDGAVELLSKYDVKPNIIFTDLDGLQLSTVSTQDYDRTFFVVHAHGDNQTKLLEFESLIQSNMVIGTTQTNSKGSIINSGGFTDGDRALYFLESFLSNTQTLYLIGYDFSPTVGKFSKPYLTDDVPASLIKKKKLDYGAQLTRDFCIRTESKVLFLESRYSFTLKSELENLDNCEFLQLQSKEDIETILPIDQLFLKS
ncbi:MAG: 6-hydroxymethylpterin diphosphokinase MptE-like protein [Promethearchaeota archaeon]